LIAAAAASTVTDSFTDANSSFRFSKAGVLTNSSTPDCLRTANPVFCAVML
jgi:hypothetical protein